MEAPSDVAKLSRQELYDQLWKTPVTKLAREYGISDVGLAKICKRHDIPRPPRGHWAKLANGKRVRRPPLPKLDDEALEEIRIFRNGFFNEAESTEAKPPEQPKTVVPDVLVEPHPLVKSTRTILRSTKRGDDGIIHPDRATSLNIRVAPASVSRALLIFDTFVKQWERLGGQVLLGKHGNDAATFVRFGDADVPVELFEETQREAADEKPERHWSYRSWKHRPTGKLVLQVDGATWGCQRRWADGKRLRVENRIDSFITGIREILEAGRLHRLDDECVERQRARRAEVREAEKMRTKAEKKRRNDVASAVRGWRKAEQIRTYLSALREKLDSKVLAPTNPEAFAEWFEWATWYADYLDPLTPTPPRPESEPEPVNTPVEQLDLTRDTRRIVQQLSVPDTDALYSVEKAVIDKYCDHWHYRGWSEICRVLEGLRYDVSDRQYYDW
jgi:hypothetical protein